MLEPISGEYLDLSAVSWNARYQAIEYGAARFDEALGYHAAIEKHINDLFADGR
ncbi:MAG: hypothetical protein ABSH56_16620 [Bryobacteraceae bacterium]